VQRDALASEIKQILEGAVFKGQPVDEVLAASLILEGVGLLSEVTVAAGDLPD